MIIDLLQYFVTQIFIAKHAKYMITYSYNLGVIATMSQGLSTSFALSINCREYFCNLLAERIECNSQINILCNIILYISQATGWIPTAT